MIITCPNCQTRYQLANDAIGSAGRKVQCANCQVAWQATPEFPKPTPKPRVVTNQGKQDSDDRLFGADDEKGLDEEFSAEEQRLSAMSESVARVRAEVEASTAPQASPKTVKADPVLTKKQQRAFSKRRDDLISSLPYAKVRRTMRMVGLVGLVCLIGGGLYFRTDIVRQAPSLAGIYESIGLGVNVVGLEFRDVKTLLALKDGANVMMIEAKIANVNRKGAGVPQVMVTLVGANNEPLYQWSVTPDVKDLGPGEMVKFQTQLASPPAGTEQVKLTFLNSRTQSDRPVENSVETGAH